MTMTGWQALIEEEATRVKLTIQAAEMGKQTIQQEAQSLTSVIEYLRNTTVMSVDEFLRRLKLEFNLFPVDKRKTQMSDTLPVKEDK